jgi:hypothetical protein
MQFLTTIMSHHLSQDKAVKKLGMSENILLRIIPSQVLFKSMKANFQPEHCPEIEKSLRVCA